MDAIALLKQQHRALNDLLVQLVETTTRATVKRGELLDRIRAILGAHTRIEEEIFYPAFRDAAESKADVRLYHEALEEHRAAGELVLPDVLGTDATSEKFSGRAKVLKELIEHHADEEESEMLPRARKLLSHDEMNLLGERMQARYDELIELEREAN